MKYLVLIVIILGNCSTVVKMPPTGVTVKNEENNVIIIATGKASAKSRKGSFYRQNISCNHARELAYEKMRELYPENPQIPMLFEQKDVRLYSKGDYCRMEYHKKD